MKQKKLNCIRGTLRHRLPGLGSLLALTLAALLLASPALAAGDNAIVPKVSLANKPEVTIQGNVVVDDNGAPTGFYELALCVRSPKRVVDVNGLTDDPANPGTPVAPGTEISESAYHAYVAANPGTEGDFTVTYYPFAAASAVVEINADVLTAVNWDVESVTYDEWDAAANAYKTAGLDSAYPRGIDLTPTTGGNFDPDVWSATDPEPFPDITTATLQGIHRVPVALDAEGDRSAFTAAAQVDDYAETATAKTALVTLSAHAPDNKPVIYTKSTPVAVVRFSYDLARFPKGTVMVNSAVGDVRNRVTGTAANEGFWLGLDRGNNTTVNSGKTPLTWLADTALGTGGNSYDYSDARDAATEAGQAVWTKLSSKDTSGGSIAEWTDTEYYYYLGGEYPSGSGAEGTVSVSTPGGIQDVEHVWVPNTASRIKILAEGTQENPMPGAGDTWTQAQYSYYNNLISLNGGVRLELVNAPTFRAPRGKGIGGNQILFYDWDDTLIGALIVDDGDVRKEVNEYVEKNLVHPDLRSGDILNNNLGGTVPDFTTPPAAGSDAETYQNLISSLDREYTYRGEHDSVYGGGANSVSYPEKGQPGYDETTAGSSYPLTNKLDYAFYKRLNTVTTVETEDAATGKTWTERYFTVNDLTADEEAAKYPWAYGWAIVADPDNHTLSTKADWPVQVDSVKLADTWTTFGVGELGDQTPKDGNILSGFATPTATGGPSVTYPGGLSTDWSTEPTRQDPTQYAYQTSSADANGYLRFADFSDLSAMFQPGQNVLIVKAVYEPGTSLDRLGNYTVVPDSLDMRRYSVAASTQSGIYSFAFRYQRGGDSDGTAPFAGVRRVRDPAVKTGFTFDAKSVDETVDLSKQGTFYLQNLANGGDTLDVDLTSGGDLWNMEYTLVERYGTNFGNGANRSKPNELGELIKKNFLYDEDDPKYDERQGTDGFVTQLTLMTLLEEASKAARNEDNSLTNHVSLATIQDLNFKMAVGDPPAEYDAFSVPYVADYIRDLVKRLYDDGVSIDPKTGNVTLTWHQVQRHILMCEAAGGVATAGIYSGGVLMSDSQCAGFAWCRLDDCAGDVKMDINSVNDVLTALYMIDTLPSTDKEYKKAYEAIYGDGSATSTGVTATTLYGYGFRYHADGVPYDASAGDAALKTAILDDLMDAVKLLAPGLGTNPDWSTVSWPQIQEAIIRGNMGASTPATLNFWWQPTPTAPGGTPPAITKWDELLKYSYQALVGVDVDGDGTPDATVPDAFDAFTSAQVSKTLLDAMIKEDVEGQSTGDYANMGWFRKGVDSNGEAVEFASVEEFETAWKAAVQVLAKPAPAGGGYDTPDKLKTATWEELQYALITGTYKSHTDILAETAGTAAGPLQGQPLYWNDGGQPELKFDALLDAINEYYFSGGATSTKLDKLLVKGVDPVNNQAYIRKDDTGSSFADVAEFKDAVFNALQALQFSTYNGASFVDSSTGTDKMVLDEYELQYLLIHYGAFGTDIVNMPTSQEIQDAHTADETVNNYWWFDGGAPSGAMPIRNIKELFTAYFWYTGTSTGVSGQNPDALNRLDETVMETLGLRADDWGVPYKAVTTSEVIAALAKTPYNAQLLATASDADLAKELQHALLTGTYAPAASITDNYWWQVGDKSYPIPTNQQEVLEAIWKTHIGNAAGDTVSEAETALKALDIDFITNRKDGMAMRKDLDGNAFADANAFYTALAGAADAMKAGSQGYSDLASITQRQLQWMLLGNPYDTNDNVENATIDKTDPAKPVDAYWWFTSDTKPGDEPTKKEKPIDPAKWSTFIQGVNNYAMLGDDTAFNDGSITLDMVNDELYLRKADGSKFADWSEVYDGSCGEIIVNALYALTSSGDKYAEFWDPNDGVTLIKEPSWYEFQYAIIHTDEINMTGVFPSLDDVKAESEEKYDWRYETTDPKPPEPGKTEKPIDETKWSAFMQGLNNYAMLGDDTAFNDGSITLATVNDDLLLRKADGSKFADWSEVYDGSMGEVIVNALYALTSSGDKYTEFWDVNDGVTMIKEPTWYEFQYAILHMDEINMTGEFPSLDDVKAESEEKYEWRYETGGGEDPGPTKTEIEIDAAKWTTFIQGLNEYAMIGDPAAFDGGALTNALSMINDDLLLRKADGSEFADWSEVYDGSMGEILTNALYAFTASGDKYAEFWDQNDGVTLIKEPSWYEMQYAIIHMDEINMTGEFPSLEDCKKECEEKWDWKYTTS